VDKIQLQEAKEVIDTYAAASIADVS